MAKKTRYHFDHSNLVYVVKHNRMWDYVKRFLWHLLSGIVFTAVCLVIAYNFLASPREKSLLRENEQMRLQYDMLSERYDELQILVTELQERDDNIYRVIFESEPIARNVRRAAIGASNKYAAFEGFNSSDLIIETSKKADELSRQVYVQSKSFDEVFKLAKNKEALTLSIPALQPISNKDLKYISSTFGYRIHPFFKKYVYHNGIDFSAPVGTPVYAPGDGVVIDVNPANFGYGKTIQIDHGFGIKSLYAHLNSFKVKRGQSVKRGDVIGTVGNSGMSTGPHLHYEVELRGENVNPAFYFFGDTSISEYSEMLDVSPNYKSTESAN